MTEREAERLISEYEWLVGWLASRYRIPAMDTDDLRQEARLALLRAAAVYDPARVPFGAFANLVIRRRLDTLVRLACCRRRGSGSLPLQLEEEWANVPAAPSALDETLRRESVRELVESIGTLSPWQRRCLVGFELEGRPYAEIGPEKSVDNALLKARRKLRAAA